MAERDETKVKLKALTNVRMKDMSASEKTKHNTAKQRLTDRIQRYDERLLKMEMDKKLKV